MHTTNESKIKLEDFQKLKEAGIGAAGKVWKARVLKDLTFAKKGTLVALKIYNEEILKDPKERERIAREYRTGSKLVHPNLIRMNYVDIESPQPFLVMEWCQGYNLKEWREAKREPDEGFLLQFVTQILDALDFLHSSKHFHRDVKPTNTHIDKEGRIRLMDYGVVKPLRDTSITDKEGPFLGTYQYAAPEYILDDEYSYASDLYSFGGTLYFLLHGYDIFSEAKDYKEIIEAKKRHRIHFDQSLKPKGAIWTALFELSEQLLKPHPQQRPQSAMACIDILSKIVPILIPFRVYFAAALTRMSEESKQKMDKIVGIVQKVAERTGYSLYLPKKYTDPLGAPELSAREVYWIDRERVASSDLLFVYADEPSFGVGQEVEIAVNAGVPIVILYSKGARVSRMLLGTAGRIIGQIEFERASEIEPKLKKFFDNNKSRLILNRKTREREYHLRLGNRMRNIRESKGISIENLAEKSEVNKELIISLETRPEKLSSISIINLRRLARTLGAVPAELLKDQSGEEQRIEDIWRSNLASLRDFALEAQLTYDMYAKLKTYGRDKFHIQIERTSARGDEIIFRSDHWKAFYEEMLENKFTFEIKIPVSDD